MRHKKKLFLLLIIPVLVIIYAFFHFESSKIIVDLEDPAYAYLPESAKNFILTEAKKGYLVLTEKNKQPNQIYLNPKYVEYLALPADLKAQEEVVPYPYTFDNTALKTETNFASSYNLKDDGYITRIKNQSSLGICWAFATISSIETNIMVSGLASKTAFAERQLDYLLADELEEMTNPYALKNLKTKGYPSYFELNDHELGKGSNFVEANIYLSMGLAPIEESTWGTYDTSKAKRSINEVINNDKVNYQVAAYATYGENLYNKDYSLEIRNAYLDLIKNHIKNNGSLYVATISPDNNAGPCYNAKKKLINYSENNEMCANASMHAMSIVGWDDNYESGAWILKNSWGNLNLPYVYLTYDSDFYDVTGVLEVKAKTWDNSYNITKKNVTNYSPTNYEVKYFKAVDFTEKFDSLNFFSWTTNSTYKVFLASGEEDYKLVKTVHLDYPGLITVSLDDVYFEASSFSVKIVAEGEGYLDGGINVFTSNVESDRYEELKKISKTAKLEEELIVRNGTFGENMPYYLFDLYGKEYLASSDYLINGTISVSLDMKSYPDGDYYLTFLNDPFEVETYANLFLNQGDEQMITYTKSDLLVIKNISYTSSNESIVSVSAEGLVTAHKLGEATILVNFNGNIEREINVNVQEKPIATTLQLLESDQKIYLNLTPTKELHLNLAPAHEVERVIWTSSDESIAIVEAGHVTFLSSGVVQIRARIDNLEAGVTFDVSAKAALNLINVSKTTLNILEEIPLELSPSSDFNLWVSANDVIEVQDGVIRALSEGTSWLYYESESGISGVCFEVVDSTKNYNLALDSNGGSFFEPTSLSKTSLEKVLLSIPTYAVKMKLIIDDNQVEETTITHEFECFRLLGLGELNLLEFTFGHGDATLVATYNYQTYTLEVPTKEGYIFAGWYEDADFTQPFTLKGTFIPKESHTLYAKFVPLQIGDINLDTEVDITDLVLLRRALALLITLDENGTLTADINKDNVVDITDLVILRRYLAGLEEF